MNIKPHLVIEEIQPLTEIQPLQFTKYEKLTKLAPKVQTAATQPQNSSQGKPAAGWFPWGQCTWFVWSKRSVGFWNDATDWLWQAKRDGWATGTVPKIGAIAWQHGHVALVTGISGSNVTITESNYKGLGVISSRTVPATTFQYIY